MSKRFEREEKQLERLEREIRELKAENRALLQRVKSYSKGYYKFMFADTEEEEKTAIKEAKKIAQKECWTCHGTLQRVDVGNRYFYKCQDCSKTTHSKIINEEK